MRRNFIQVLLRGTAFVPPSLTMFATAAMMVAGSGDARGQVFIQGVNSGNNVVDTPGNSYPSSAQTILRVTGGTATYNGQNITGSTLATANAFIAAQAQSGGTITFTGTSAFTGNGTSSGAFGFSAEGANSLISAGIVSLSTVGPNSYGFNATGANARISVGQATIGTTGSNAHGVNISNGATVNLGTGSRVTTETGAGVNASGGTFTASNLTIVTNNSQQSLVPTLLGLPQYPNLVGIDPIDLTHAPDPFDLGVFAIAAPAKGISASGGSTVQLSGTTNITSGSIGLYVDNSTATLTGTTVINAGPGGTDNTFMNGVQVTNGGTVTLTGGPITLNVNSVAGSGVRSEGTASNAILNSNGGLISISLLNTRSDGINNVNEAAALYSPAGTIQVTGNLQLDTNQGRGYGLWTGANPASTIRIAGDTAIATHGREAFGIRLDDGLMQLTGNLSIVTGINPSSPDAMNGGGAAGLRAIKGSLAVSGATSVTTVGDIVQVGSSNQTSESAYGLWNTSESRIPGNGASVNFTGPATIQTGGNAAHGIYNDTVSGTFTFANTVNITTTGGLGTVTWFRTLGIVPVNETVGAWGVNSAVSGTTTFLAPLTITTSGNSSGGVRSTGGTVNVQDSMQIRTAGANAYGLWASSATATTTFNGSINVAGPTDISTTGAGAHDIFADRGGNIQLTGGATLRVADPSAKGILASGNSSITGSGHFDVLANLQSMNNAQLNLSMNSSSVFTGTTTRSDASAFNLTLADNSLWTMTGNSNLTNLTNDPSQILFTPPVGDPTLLSSYKTLTVVNYVGLGGIIGLNTYLGADGSPSDRLVIDGGTASGNSLLRIANAGGAGALTTGNGILVVDTINGGTTVPGTFALAARVAAGPYDYTLFRSSVDASNDQAWYLRSTIDCRLSPGDPICPPPGPGPGPTPPNFRPETSLYAAVPSMALLYGRTLLDTLHERVGDEENLRNQQRLNGVAAGAWGRVIGQHGNNEGDPLGVFGSGPKFDYNIGAFQGGQDLLRREGADGSRDHAGLYAAVGLLTGDVTHFDHTFAGSNSLNAYSIGGYWTHFGATGWYLDAILQGTRYNVRSASTSLPALTTNGWGFASSLEGGYPFHLGGGFIIEPQAQIVYQNVGLDDSSDAAATVQFRNAASVAARIGARLARTWSLDNSAQFRSITAWIRPSLWNEFRGAPQTLFSSAAGPVPFQSNIGGAWFEANAGLDAQITKATSLFASAGYQVSTDGNTTAYNGKGGLRVAW